MSPLSLPNARKNRETGNAAISRFAGHPVELHVHQVGARTIHHFHVKMANDENGYPFARDRVVEHDNFSAPGTYAPSIRETIQFSLRVTLSLQGFFYSPLGYALIEFTVW